MSQGFTFTEAAHMAPADYRRYMAIAHAWSIPPERRVRNVMATRDDLGLLA